MIIIFVVIFEIISSPKLLSVIFAGFEPTTIFILNSDDLLLSKLLVPKEKYARNGKFYTESAFSLRVQTL
jgi:hypothetical protein